jgi:protein-S-isoprenylcysteine O-methyltransferase Ste14
LTTPNKPAAPPPRTASESPAPRPAALPLAWRWQPDSPARQHGLALLLAVILPAILHALLTASSPGQGLLAFVSIALGFGTIAAGVALYLWWVYAAWQHRDDESWAPPWRLGHGPTAISRHPGWLAVMAVTVGQALIAPTVTFWVYTLIVVTGLNWLVRRLDEPRLENVYGVDYIAYRDKVPRWFPWRQVMATLREVVAMLRESIRGR